MMRTSLEARGSYWTRIMSRTGMPSGKVRGFSSPVDEAGASAARGASWGAWSVMVSSLGAGWACVGARYALGRAASSIVMAAAARRAMTRDSLGVVAVVATTPTRRPARLIGLPKRRTMSAVASAVATPR